MAWYGVHVVMAVRFKDGIQDAYPAWENVYLIRADDSDEATQKAEAIGKQNEGDSSGTFHWNDRPAEWVFRGVRKVIEVANSRSTTNTADDGAEVTYQTIEFDNEKTLTNYIDGKPAIVKIVD